MVYDSILSLIAEGKKLFAVLVDPDKSDDDHLMDLAKLSADEDVHCFLVGGSLMTSDRMDHTIEFLKELSGIPVIIFPGSVSQVHERADAILFLSLISGRNPEYLIGQQVVAAPYIRKSGLEVLPTGYMLIENESNTTANYMSNTLPIPRSKSDIAACTAMAGEMLGHKLIYMDGGSGAGGIVPPQMVAEVKKNISLPLVVGGGIRTIEDAMILWNSGADMIVVGNAIEEDINLVSGISRQLKTAYGN